MRPQIFSTYFLHLSDTPGGFLAIFEHILHKTFSSLLTGLVSSFMVMQNSVLSELATLHPRHRDTILMHLLSTK